MLARTLLGVLLALVLVGCGSTEEEPLAGVQTPDSHGYNGTHLDEPYVPAPVPLTDTSGDQVALDDTSAPLRLVFFGYTNCPDICQVVVSTMASALTRLPDDQREQVEGVFVTTDPARDTPSALRDYLDRFDPSFIGLTASLDDVIAAGKPLGIYVEKGEKLPSGGYEVNHGTAVIGVQDGTGRIVWTQGTSPGEMAEDISRLLKENA